MYFKVHVTGTRTKFKLVLLSSPGSPCGTNSLFAPNLCFEVIEYGYNVPEISSKIVGSYAQEYINLIELSN